jgi:hypothetical protein
VANRLEGRQAIEVYVNMGGRVTISQEDSLGNEPAYVEMDPRDVPTVIKWLREVAKEAKEFVPEPSQVEERK